MELEGLPADGDGDDDSLLDGDTDGLTDDDAEGLTELEGDTLLLGETDGDAELLGDTEGETLLVGEPASSAGAKPARTTPICADNDVVAIKERLPEANAPLLSKILAPEPSPCLSVVPAPAFNTSPYPAPAIKSQQSSTVVVTDVVSDVILLPLLVVETFG